MRIIAHTCSNTEIVCALGLEHLLIGVDEHSDYPVEVVRELPKIGPDLDIDIDKIQALNPDMVITSLTVPGHEACVEKLHAAGIPYLLTEPKTLADTASDIETIANALHVPQQGQLLAAQFRQTIADEQKQTAAKQSQPIPVLVEWWPKPVIVPAQDSWINQMLDIVGAYNPWENKAGKSLTINDEQALDSNSAAIVMSWCGVKEEKYHSHVVTRRDGWQDLPAIKNHHVYPISEAYLGRPGPRLLQGIQRLREVVNNVNHN